MASDPTNTHAPIDRKGLLQGATAYAIWGLLPLYFALLKGVGAGEVVANRILWSLVLLIVLIFALGHWQRLRAALVNPRAMAMLSLSAALISVNWLVYIWSVQNHHVLAASLGYFLNPLVNVVLGLVVLGERLNRVQTASVLLAAMGVAVLGMGAGTALWISVTLAFSFGFYGLVRKLAPVESLEGLTIETGLLAPIAALFLMMTSGNPFGHSTGIGVLLIASGVITALPLLLFAAAARRLRYATLGLLQYLAPTGQFLLAVLVFGEPLSAAHVFCFAMIWTGLAIYAAEGSLSARQRRKLAAAG